MKVGVIGAGTMGSGIAQAFAQTEGYEVYLCDINDEFAANGKKKIAKGFEKRVARGKMDQAKADAILAKITTGTKDICTDADLVVNFAANIQQFFELCEDTATFLHGKQKKCDFISLFEKLWLFLPSKLNDN